MYTKNNYIAEIKSFIASESYNTRLIAKCTYEIYLDHIKEIDHKLRDNLLEIASMESGPEFEMTEKEFDDFLKKM